VQVGFGKVSYLWPIFAGDTLRKRFTVNKIRPTSDGNHSVIHFTCELYNQRDRLCMQADKRMLFQMVLPESASFVPSNTSVAPSSSTSPAAASDGKKVDTHLFRDHLLSRAVTVLANQPSHSLTRLEPGMLVWHTLHRSLTFSQSQQLASLARLTHARHFDTRRYNPSSEILIPGGLVLGLALSASARDLHEILFEEIQSCSYVNTVHPSNIVGAMSYIADVDDTLPGDLEGATIRTLGIKDLHLKRDLEEVLIPVELFEPGIFAKEIEQICKTSCPILSGKIVVQAERKIVRQTAHREVFLL
jgi:hypothetical protein